MEHKPECQTITLAENATNRWWPVCDCGAVDPHTIRVYGSNQRIGKPRSKMMDEDLEICGYCGEEGHWEEDCEEMAYDEQGIDRESYNIRDFLGKLEDFLEGELEDISRGNVFLAETDDGVSLNILIGTPFTDHGDETLKQINVIIAPTDRELLGAEDLSIRSGMDRPVEDETGDEDDYSSPFDEAMQILD